MVFVAGPHNAGKSTLARWLVSRGMRHIETGDIIRSEYNRTDHTTSFQQWAKDINDKNPDYFNELILKEISGITQDLQKLVITGNRQYEGIEYLIRHIGTQGGDNTIIYLDASPQELFRRQRQRVDRDNDVTYDKFLEYLSYDDNMGIKKIKEKAHFVINGEQHRDKVHELAMQKLLERGVLFSENDETTKRYERR